MKRICLSLFFILSLQFVYGQTIKENIGKLLRNAPAINQNGLKKRMPGKILDVKPAYYGALAIIKFEDKKRLGIFNPAQCQFEKFITLKSSSFIFATGADLLVVFYPASKTVEKWDLTTFKKISEKKIELEKGFIDNIAMGAAIKSRAFISGSVGGGALDRRFYGLLDLDTYSVKPFSSKIYFSNSSYRDLVELRCNNKLSKVLIWRNSRFDLVNLGGDTPVVKRGSSSGGFNFTNNDTTLVSTGGDVLSAVGEKVKSFKDNMLFPVLGGDFYIQYTGSLNHSSHRKSDTQKTIRVKELGSHSTLLEVKSPFTYVRERSYNVKSLPSDRFIVAAKIPDRLMVIDNTNHYIYTFAMGIKGKGGGGLPSHAGVGKPWRFNLALPKGTKVVIEDGPSGLKYDAASGSLIWLSPDSIGVKGVLLSITKPGTEEYYKEYKILVK